MPFHIATVAKLAAPDGGGIADKKCHGCMLRLTRDDAKPSKRYRNHQNGRALLSNVECRFGCNARPIRSHKVSCGVKAAQSARSTSNNTNARHGLAALRNADAALAITATLKTSKCNGAPSDDLRCINDVASSRRIVMRPILGTQITITP